MNEKPRKHEGEQNLPVIFRSPDYSVISNGEKQTSLTTDKAKGVLKFFDTNQTELVYRTHLHTAARKLGFNDSYPDTRAFGVLRSTLERIGMESCAQHFYGTHFRLNARIEVDESLKPVDRKKPQSSKPHLKI